MIDAIALVPDLRQARAAAGHMLLGLDFDGTLAPIVPIPDDAGLPAATQSLLEALAARADTRVAVLSGRGLRDLAARLGIAGVYYAGNHGLEIEGPGVHRIHAEAVAAAGALARVVATLEQRFGGEPGVIVEDKGLTASVHYRLVDDPGEAARIRDGVHACSAREPRLRATDGKKVVEIRPDVDWHKGRALGFLRATLTADYPAAPTVFIGDDRTDEDAFRELGDEGWSIIVGDPPPADTAARAVLPDTRAVAEFLRRLL
jgi:trehalose 6-phosphate phosphatase